MAGGLEIKSVARRRDLHSSASLGAPFKGQNGVISGISLKVHESTSVLKSLKKDMYLRSIFLKLGCRYCCIPSRICFFAELD